MWENGSHNRRLLLCWIPTTLIGINIVDLALEKCVVKTMTSHALWATKTFKIVISCVAMMQVCKGLY